MTFVPEFGYVAKNQLQQWSKTFEPKQSHFSNVPKQSIVKCTGIVHPNNITLPLVHNFFFVFGKLEDPKMKINL